MVRNTSTNVGSKPIIVFGVTSSSSITILGDIPRALARQGWRVFVIADFGILDDVPHHPSIEYRHIPMKRKPAPFQDAIALARWILELWSIKPDILSVGTPKAGLLAILASRILNVPQRVYHLRGLRLQTASGIVWPILWALEWLTSRMSTQVVAVSFSLAAEYMRLSLSRPERIQVLGKGSSHGVDIDAFSNEGGVASIMQRRKELELSTYVPILGFVGRFTRDKGVDILPFVRQYLLDNGCDHELIVVGPVEDSVNSALQLDNFERPTRFFGQVSNVAHHLSTCDVLLLPTKREGFPNVVLEAALLGIPTVTTRVTGALDAVKHGETGLVAAPDNKVEFAEFVLSLSIDEEKRRKLGRQAREYVKKYFDQSSIAAAHSEFLSRLVFESLPPSSSN